MPAANANANATSENRPRRIKRTARSVDHFHFSHHDGVVYITSAPKGVSVSTNSGRSLARLLLGRLPNSDEKLIVTSRRGDRLVIVGAHYVSQLSSSDPPRSGSKVDAMGCRDVIRSILPSMSFRNVRELTWGWS